VQAVRDVGDLASGTKARVLGGDGFLYWRRTKGLWGCTIWETADGPKAEALASILAGILAREVPRHDLVLDVRDLVATTSEAFEVLRAFPALHWDAHARTNAPLVVVVPSAPYARTIFEGMRATVAVPFTVDLTEKIDDALTMLGAACDPAVASAELEAARAATGAAPILRSLRALLERRPGRVSIAGAAKELGVSERTLQRRLLEESTSFQRERAAAQVRVAQRLLRAREATLARVAVEVGCPSVQHFSALFRRVTGETPAAWRKSVAGE
jgi:AraC-like DNA-binding protein